MRLAHRDLDRVLHILPELYAHGSPLHFFNRSMHLLKELVECDHAAWFEYRYADRVSLVMVVESEPRVTANVVASLEEGVSSHPLSRHYKAGRTTAAALLSDTPCVARAAHRERYEHVYRLLELNHEIVLPVVLNRRRALGVSFRRRLRNFTERDRTVLNLLQPHLRRAHANAEWVEARESGADCVRAEPLRLTPRELEVATWIAAGKTNLEISMILGSATRTVEKHVEHLFSKLGVENRTTAAIQVRRLLEDLPNTFTPEHHLLSAPPAPATRADP